MKVTVRVGSGVFGAGALGGVRSSAGGCTGAADATLGAADCRGSRRPHCAVFHKNTAGGRLRFKS